MERRSLGPICPTTIISLASTLFEASLSTSTSRSIASPTIFSLDRNKPVTRTPHCPIPFHHSLSLSVPQFSSSPVFLSWLNIFNFVASVLRSCKIHFIAPYFLYKHSLLPCLLYIPIGFSFAPSLFPSSQTEECTFVCKLLNICY